MCWSSNTHKCFMLSCVNCSMLSYSSMYTFTACHQMSNINIAYEVLLNFLFVEWTNNAEQRWAQNNIPGNRQDTLTVCAGDQERLSAVSWSGCPVSVHKVWLVFLSAHIADLQSYILFLCLLSMLSSRGRGGGELAYEKGSDACWKFWIKPLM